MKKPIVSIIVPNYNHAFFLNQRLESIFNQNYENFEVIILDDFSTDDSQEILLQYANHPNVSHCIFNETNSGSTFKQWNKGIALAKGDYVWIAESDDYCEKNFLERLLVTHINHPEISLAYCQSHRMNSSGEVTGNWITHTSEFDENIFQENFVMDGNEYIEKYLIHKNVIPNVSAVLFRKKALEKIFPLIFKPFMKYTADWFYYIQLICNSKVAFVSDTLNFFRYHDSSVIAKAGSQTGWLEIFKMELRVRMEMLNYLEACSANNINAIREQSKLGDKKLRFLRAKGYINRGGSMQGLQIALISPSIFRKTFGYFLTKKIKRLWWEFQS